MRWLLFALIAAIALFWLYVNYAPMDAGRVHVAAEAKDPGDTVEAGSFHAVRAITTAPEGVLRAMEQAALGTANTRLIAGSIDEGMLTFETRTRFGFPDYTTVSIISTGAAPGGNAAPLLSIYGRLRFGASDLGVNKARIEGWLTQLGPLVVAP